MLNYAVCEIGGKQYKIYPNQTFEIPYQEETHDVEVSVLLLAENSKVKLGSPYLKEKITLKGVGNTLGKKIRVSKYHAKANDRKVTGIRPKFTKVSWVVKTA